MCGTLSEWLGFCCGVPNQAVRSLFAAGSISGIAGLEAFETFEKALTSGTAYGIAGVAAVALLSLSTNHENKVPY